MRPGDRRCLIALLGLYVLVFGWLLGSTQFLPYVMDNNETFSALWHASNLFNYGIGKTFGLADESYALTAAAHPYVYTHGGNWPRVFALALYALGARTAEAQIAITTFSVGIVAIVLAYRFFRQISNGLFALICCVLLITDYAVTAQWQVVTYRVWEEFFVFSSLLCVHGFAERNRLAAVLAVVNFACLFYYELVFALFVALSAAFYAAMILRRTPRRFFGFWSLQAAGAAVACGLLVLQIVLYMGWPKFLDDVYLTYLARNQYSDSAALLARMEEFFGSNHIVFWYNLESSAELRHFGRFFASLVLYDFQPHTPYFTNLCWIVLVGLLGHWVRNPFRRSTWPSAVPDARGGKAGLAKAALAGVLVFIGGFFLFASLLSKARIWGITGDLAWYKQPGIEWALLMALAPAGLVLLWTTSRARPYSPSPAAQIRSAPVKEGLKIATFLLFASVLIVRSHKLYNLDPTLWLEIIGTLVPGWSSHVLAVLCTALGAVFLLRGSALPAETGMDRTWWRLAAFIGSGFVAYTIVFLMFPGTVFTGYRERLVPLTAFHTVTLTALVFYALLAFGWARLTAYRSARRSAAPGPGGDLVLGVASFALLAFLGYYWIGTQAILVRRLPPDSMSVLDKLSRPPYRGATFVTNAYAAPVAAKAGNWAYMNEALVDNDVDMAAHEVLPPETRYLWFADKDSNPAYARPDYFLCITIQSMYTAALDRLHSGSEIGCQMHALVRLARSPRGRQTEPRLELADVDREGPEKVGYERWAIVRMRWSDASPPSRAHP